MCVASVNNPSSESHRVAKALAPTVLNSSSHSTPPVSTLGGHQADRTASFTPTTSDSESVASGPSLSSPVISFASPIFGHMLNTQYSSPELGPSLPTSLASMIHNTGGIGGHGKMLVVPHTMLKVADRGCGVVSVPGGGSGRSASSGRTKSSHTNSVVQSSTDDNHSTGESNTAEESGSSPESHPVSVAEIPVPPTAQDGENEDALPPLVPVTTAEQEACQEADERVVMVSLARAREGNTRVSSSSLLKRSGKAKEKMNGSLLKRKRPRNYL